MQKSKKILICVISLILLIAAVWFGYYLIHYHFYNEYRKDLSAYEYEEGTTFSPVSEASADVEGMVLAKENENLKLYVNVESGETAVYDKRNGQTIYSNPIDADQDEIANGTNKNYLKSQIILDYFNTARTQGTYDSFSYCTEKGQLEVESIKDGVRFLYTMGDLTSATGIVPQYISAEALERVTSALSESDASFVRKKFIESSCSR